MDCYQTARKTEWPPLQLQALSQLAAGVNKLVEVNVKRMKLEEEHRETLLKFRRDEATKKSRP